MTTQHAILDAHGVTIPAHRDFREAEPDETSGVDHNGAVADSAAADQHKQHADGNDE